MKTQTAQTTLFDAPPLLPPGLVYEPEFLGSHEETHLLAEMGRLPFNEARFQQFVARRRIVRYGEGDYLGYGNGVEEANPRHSFPEFLVPLKRRVAQWVGVPESEFGHALVTEYAPGTPIGWHRDAPHFGVVVGISLGGAARMRFRPIAAKGDRKAIAELQLAPRSVYVLQSAVRWDWQHQIPPTKALRYSITFRTPRRAIGAAADSALAA